MASTPYRSRFGDTTLTKVFVGGLAWETPNEKLRRHFEQFGEILEAVVITDKATGRSKGYGFVTFRDPESARRACVEPNPVIDGRRANCNIASQGLPRLSARGRAQAGNTYQGGPQHLAQPYNRIPPQMQPPPPGMYPPYGYMAYAAEYGYQPAFYNPQLAPQYQHHMYGPTSPSRVGPTYPYTTVGYTMQTSPRAGFPLVQHVHRMQGPPPPPPPPLLPYVQYPAVGHGGEASFVPSSSNQQGFQLQSPPTRPSHDNTSESQSPQQQQTTTGTSIESSDAS